MLSLKTVVVLGALALIVNELVGLLFCITGCCSTTTQINQELIDQGRSYVHWDTVLKSVTRNGTKNLTYSVGVYDQLFSGIVRRMVSQFVTVES